MPSPTVIDNLRMNRNSIQTELNEALVEEFYNRGYRILAFLSGVVAPTAKPVSDATLNLIPEKKGIDLVKGSYEILKNFHELKNSDSGKEVLKKSIDILVTNENNDHLSSFWSGTKALTSFKQGDWQDGIESGAESLSNYSKKFKFVQPFFDGARIKEGWEQSKSNFEEWHEENDRLNDVFEKNRSRLEDLLSKEDKKLFEATGGKEGSLSGMKNSGNVFNRIAALCAEIRVKIGEVQHNLEVQ